MFKILSALALAVLSSLAMSAQTAKIQIIHNAADPAAASVDIYANGVQLLNNVAFRTATPYTEVPAGVPITIAIAPDTSTSVASKIFEKTVTLELGGVYVAIANGLINSGGFSQNSDPNAKPLAFDIYAVGGRTRATTSGNVDLFAWHGATDAPAVDVVVGSSRLIENLSYGNASAYRSVPPGVYDLGVAPAGGSAIATFRADLTKLADSAIIVVASGFLDPSKNSGGPAFGLFAVTASGGAFSPLPVVPTPTFAQVQIIHNAADPAAAVVDIWAGTDRLLNDVAFRTASNFLTVPAGVEISIGVAPGDSESASASLATFKVTLEPRRYIVVASGLLDTTGFASNGDVDAAARGFNLYVADNVLPGASTEGNVDILVFHGATDAPKVDVVAGDSRLIEGLSYGKFANYLSVPAGSYVLGVAPAGGAPIASFTADVTGLVGQAIAVVASGFLDPAANKSGAAFGLFAALPSGGALIPLPAVTTSVQEANSEVRGLSVSPNPATQDAVVRYSITGETMVRARLVDVTGSAIATFDLGFQFTGEQQMSLNVSNVPSGPYFLMIDTNTGSITAPVSILR